jgi:phospholipid/cholesterol/gamma-HCH transport system ATP-binding protein
VPDNLGLLFLRRLVMFGPREQLLTSTEPVVEQFLNGRREGPIGMSEEKDAAQVQAELASLTTGGPAPGTGPKGATGMVGVPPQLEPSPGLPVRAAVARRQERVRAMLHTLPPAAQAAIRASLPDESSPWRPPASASAQ